MTVQVYLYVIALVISASTSLIAVVIVWRRAAGGSLMLVGVLLSAFVWSGAHAISWFVTGLNEKIILLKIMYLGVAAAPTLFMIFILKITQHENWLAPRDLLLLCVEPFAMVVLVWFDSSLVFDRIQLARAGGLAVLQVDWGGVLWIHACYSYAIVLFALVILTLGSLRANSFFRRQYLIILSGSLIPLAAEFFKAGYDGVAGFDLLPITFGVSVIFYSYAVFRHQFMDLLPVARGRLIESMSDGVLVLDDQNRIVDINPVMKNFLDENPSTLIGRNISEILNLWSHNPDQFLNGETRSEIKLPRKPTCYLDLRVTPLYDSNQKLSGRLLVIRDVTDRKEVEKDLRYAMDKLQTQLIEIGVLQSQLREQAIRDALTNLFNRRYLEETLERELARAARESYPLCVIMMDLDYFKVINDTYGHEAGDVVLKTLAETVTQQSRHGDFACRFGGEEFVLVMPNIGIAIARERAEGLHQLINSLNIPYGRFNLTTTISMGIAWYPAHGATKEDLLRAADKAMYMAKNTGRNRVIVYREPELSAE
ncbi:MAG TPA: diguanylate cyclase [Anaerolineales bacterium]|nr:diguanylate cyclase [Anaerolineales bacterium]